VASILAQEGKITDVIVLQAALLHESVFRIIITYIRLMFQLRSVFILTFYD
jgi:hypothetical protein